MFARQSIGGVQHRDAQEPAMRQARHDERSTQCDERRVRRNDGSNQVVAAAWNSTGCIRIPLPRRCAHVSGVGDMVSGIHWGTQHPGRPVDAATEGKGILYERLPRGNATAEGATHAVDVCGAGVAAVGTGFHAGLHSLVI